MIITMKNTETREISAKIDELHEERGEAALGRVLTLLISTNEASLEHDLEVANSASREHPCRVIAIAPNSRKMDADTDDGQPHTFLDAEVRFGSDAGAGEIIVLRPLGGLVYHADTLVIPLLVPDAPLVAERGAGEPVHRFVGLDGAQPYHGCDAFVESTTHDGRSAP